MHHIETKSVSRLFTNDQKQQRTNACPELQAKANGDKTSISIVLCFPNWKWNWRDDTLKQCFDIQKELQAVFDSIKQNGFHGAVEV
jgi:hypothetical protein